MRVAWVDVGPSADSDSSPFWTNLGQSRYAGIRLSQRQEGQIVQVQSCMRTPPEFNAHQSRPVTGLSCGVTRMLEK